MRPPPLLIYCLYTQSTSCWKNPPYYLAISIELEYSPEPDRIADWVREAHDATARLMRDAGLRG